MEKNIPILYYHFIDAPFADTKIKGLYTTANQFEWQIKRLIKKGFTFITFEDIAEKRYDTNNRNLILTFDDGCESQYLNAFPILKKYGIKAVIYVVTNSIGARSVVWEQNENRVPINILSKDQILEMSAYGIEIGSHLCHHVHLTELSLNDMKLELSDSKGRLEKELGKEVYSVAYPFGSFNGDVLKVTADAGYQFGVTTISGNNLLTNDFKLFRINVKGYSLRHYWYFQRILRGLLKNDN